MAPMVTKACCRVCFSGALLVIKKGGGGGVYGDKAVNGAGGRCVGTLYFMLSFAENLKLH